MTLKKIKETTRDETYERLREFIITGRFRPGQKLNERLLSEELSVSRTPIREALGKLELENLVTIIPYQGAVVNELTLADARKIYDMHAVLEGLMLRLAADHVTDEVLEKLRENIRRYEEMLDPFDLDKVIHYNREFHLMVYHLSNNEHLIDTLDAIRAKMSLLRVNTLSVPMRARQNLNEHKIILATMENRDGPTLEVLGKIHIQNAAKVSYEIIAKQLSEKEGG